MLIIQPPEDGLETRALPFSPYLEEAFRQAGFTPVVEFIPPPQAMETTGEGSILRRERTDMYPGYIYHHNGALYW